jgi:hypothetical protein
MKTCLVADKALVALEHENWPGKTYLKQRKAKMEKEKNDFKCAAICTNDDSRTTS